MKKTTYNGIFILLFLIIFGCKKKNNKQDISGKMENVHTSDYGVTPKGDSIKKYTLTNKNGMKVEVINFGGIITSLTAPDRNGNTKMWYSALQNPKDILMATLIILGL